MWAKIAAEAVGSRRRNRSHAALERFWWALGRRRDSSAQRGRRRELLSSRHHPVGVAALQLLGDPVLRHLPCCFRRDRAAPRLFGSHADCQPHDKGCRDARGDGVVRALRPERPCRVPRVSAGVGRWSRRCSDWLKARGKSTPAWSPRWGGWWWRAVSPGRSPSWARVLRSSSWRRAPATAFCRTRAELGRRPRVLARAGAHTTGRVDPDIVKGLYQWPAVVAELLTDRARSR